jgi:hypothetical protein
MREPKLWLSLKACGDCWLNIEAPSGKRASLNLGPRGSSVDKSMIIGRVVLEVASLCVDGQETSEGEP